MSWPFLDAVQDTDFTDDEEEKKSLSSGTQSRKGGSQIK